MTDTNSSGVERRPQSGRPYSDQSNLRLVAPPTRDRPEPLADASLATTNVLFVSYRDTTDAVVSRFRESEGGMPTTLGVVDVGGMARSSARTASLTISPAVSATTVRSDDVSGLGTAVSEFLAEWDERTVLWFDSVTALVRHAGLETAFRFLHVLVHRIRSAGARAYYRLDDGVHEQETMATIETVFDGCVEP